jgi:hypothetical protein
VRGLHLRPFASAQTRIPGIVHIIGPEQGFTVRNDEIFFFNPHLFPLSSLVSLASVVILTRQVSETRCD